MLFSLAAMGKIQKKIETKVRLVAPISIISKEQQSAPSFVKVVFIAIIKVTMLVIGGFINCGVDNLNFATVERFKNGDWRFKRWPSSELMNDSYISESYFDLSTACNKRFTTNQLLKRVLKGGSNPISQPICFTNPTSQCSKIFIPFPFWHFFPFPVPKSQSQCTQSHFPRATKGQSQLPFYPFRTLFEIAPRAQQGNDNGHDLKFLWLSADDRCLMGTS